MGGRFWLVLALAILLFGCTNPNQTNPANNSTSTTPAGPPSFIVISPEASQVFETGLDSASLNVILSTSNLALRPPSSANKIGEGHFVIQLDNFEKQNVFSKDFAISNIKIGEHTLTIELVNNDGSSYSPQLKQSILFLIRSTKIQSEDHQVTILDYSYSPREVRVKPGDSVTWTNTGQAPRTVTSTNNFNSGTITPDGIYSYTFNVKGRYDYFSVNYPGMKGTVIVE